MLILGSCYCRGNLFQTTPIKKRECYFESNTVPVTFNTNKLLPLAVTILVIIVPILLFNMYLFHLLYFLYVPTSILHSL